MQQLNTCSRRMFFHVADPNSNLKWIIRLDKIVKVPMTPNTILVKWILHDVNNHGQNFLGFGLFVNVLQRFYSDDCEVIYGIGGFFLPFF